MVNPDRRAPKGKSGHKKIEATRLIESIAKLTELASIATRRVGQKK